jgi:phenylalanyl-tRNA synthetase beta chain
MIYVCSNSFADYGKYNMKCSVAWLTEWLQSSLQAEELINSLTMAGIEVSSSSAAPTFTGVVIGEVLSVSQHPDASKLKICVVHIAQANNLTIVCGATNVIVGMKVAVATVGALLPQQLKITATLIRGINSQGMLCAASELGLTSKHDVAKNADKLTGIMELPTDAPVGVDLWQYLQLDDLIFDATITPNRGDCLSVYGLAREIAAITATPLPSLNYPAIATTITEQLPVAIQAPHDCPRYFGRIIKNIAGQQPTPMWLRERLRRSGIRDINIIVDVSNYVMLELGQPLHAFTLSAINEQIVVRFAQPGETIVLLDGSIINLSANNLVVADSQQPLALAGVMGGNNSAINTNTTAIFLESAWFNPLTIAQQRQQQQLNTEAAYRFERGVDPEITLLALERASSLLIELAGGQAGPVINATTTSGVSQPQHISEITLHRHFLDSMLGQLKLSDQQISDILLRLGAKLSYHDHRWLVKVPSWRFDWQQEIDLVEEVARCYGYEHIPATMPVLAIKAPQPIPLQNLLTRIKQLLANLGYHEIITYSFVADQLQELLNPAVQAPLLINPITSNMNVMRTSLWPGLINTYLYNRDRQQPGGNFFEAGLCFTQDQQQFTQKLLLAGLISGNSSPEQWGTTAKQVDFYDLKADIERLLQLSWPKLTSISFVPCHHPALHPGQAATILSATPVAEQNPTAAEQSVLGMFGVIHPKLVQHFALTEPVLLFTLDVEKLLTTPLTCYQEIAKFPTIRRDLAIVTTDSIPVAAITASIWQYGGKLLQQVQLFDVYCGAGIGLNKRSLAFALILQDPLRTLQESEVVATMANIVNGLQQDWAVELRT